MVNHNEDTFYVTRVRCTQSDNR